MFAKTGVIVIAAMCASALALPPTANAAGVKIGVLSCHVDRGWGYVIGSSHDVSCLYHRDSGVDSHYRGSISKFGVDLGYTGDGEIVWEVVAPTSDVSAGALEGKYAGATAGATVGIGGNVNLLVGGLDKSIALQPISVQGNTGLDVAAGIGAMNLRYDRV